MAMSVKDWRFQTDQIGNPYFSESSRKARLVSLRSLVFNGLWGVWTAILGPTIPLLWIVGSPPRMVRLISRIWARGTLMLLSGVVGLNYQQRCRENAPLTPGLIIANHQSTWETVAALVLFPDVAIVAKRELLRIPVMGWFLRRSPMIMIDRDGPCSALREMVAQSQAALAQGRSILIFPEGTRKPVGEPVEFKRGVELLYRALGVPVFPVVVNSGLFWGVGDTTKRSGTITVSFLAPIQPGLSATSFVAMAQALMDAAKGALDRKEWALPASMTVDQTVRDFAKET